jgi:hypothetical protein
MGIRSFGPLARSGPCPGAAPREINWIDFRFFGARDTLTEYLLDWPIILNVSRGTLDLVCQTQHTAAELSVIISSAPGLLNQQLKSVGLVRLLIFFSVVSKSW